MHNDKKARCLLIKIDSVIHEKCSNEYSLRWRIVSECVCGLDEVEGGGGGVGHRVDSTLMKCVNSTCESLADMIRCAGSLQTVFTGRFPFRQCDMK